MSEHDDAHMTSISRAQTLEETGAFWDTHSLDDYWDRTREVEFGVRARRRHRITLDPDLYARLEAQAHVRGISPETLANLWLVERLTEAASGAPST